jgi:ribonucleotide reductase beta subunit family protein with ferritin-like domain
MNTMDNQNTQNTQNTQDSKIDELVDESNSRLTILPINPKYEIFWNLYKKQLESFWQASEVDFSNDFKDYMTLSSEEKEFVKMILAFFAASDGIVNFNIQKRFMNEIKIQEVLVMLGFQYMMENVHGEVYSNMLNNIITNETERRYLFNAIENIESIKGMKDWAFKWIESKSSLAYLIFAAGIIEGLFFSGAFASIFWLKMMRGKNRLFMEGLVKSNKLISRDEGMHTNSDAAMYKFVTPISINDANQMIEEAITLVDKFHRDGIKVDMIGMNIRMMDEYIRYVADRLLVLFGYEKKYNAMNPFPFMELIGLDTKGNFFETRPTEYQTAHNDTNNNWNFELEDWFGKPKSC